MIVKNSELPSRLDGSTRQLGRLSREALRRDFIRVRANSLAITQPLEIEDQVIQTCADVSPTKWHLAHTTWFFETFVLEPFATSYNPFNDNFAFLFNSYYQTVGPQFLRPERGFLSRPTVSEVHDYRAFVDEAMSDFFNMASNEKWLLAREILELGLHHEQQHQELILMDIKDVLSHNPLAPAPFEYPSLPEQAALSPTDWLAFDGGVFEFGADARTRFAFDNETPRHEQLIRPFELADRLVTNMEFLEFIEGGGYRSPRYWLADGWACVEQQKWGHPRYWMQRDDEWFEYTLAGLVPLRMDAPVSHVSYYEANAYADWAEARLPTEFEWELACSDLSVSGNLLPADLGSTSSPLHAPTPRPLAPDADGLHQAYGDVWEWTQSPYAAYPGFRPLGGSLGEYNGKFMSNQFVLRGGSCATAEDHIRPTYRNFFYPHQRWQFSGLRLARDA